MGYVDVHILLYQLTFSQRDYFWNLSRAIQLAKRVIYIHDWWLSPGKRSGFTVDFANMFA